MLKVKGKPTDYVGGVIASAVEVTDPEYTVTLDSGEIFVTSDVAVADLVVDDWMVYPVDSTTDYGRVPIWEAITKEDFAKYLVIRGGA